MHDYYITNLHGLYIGPARGNSYLDAARKFYNDEVYIYTPSSDSLFQQSNKYHTVNVKRKRGYAVISVYRYGQPQGSYFGVNGSPIGCFLIKKCD